MASLSAGVLVKLLQEMNGDEEMTKSGHRSAMLQVRSIVPVMAEGDLWPNQGFYLKVSDSSHAMFVSLPNEENEMIFNNNLQLGQFIHVEKLESADPIPILRGAKLVPGKHPCVGTQEELESTVNLDGIFCVSPSSDTESKIDNVVREPSSFSASRTCREDQGKRRASPARSIPWELNNRPSTEKLMADVVSELPKINITSTDNDTDSDSSHSSCSVKSKPARRSWERTIAGIKERPGSLVLKHEAKPIARRRSVCAPSNVTSRCDISDDGSSCKPTGKRNTSTNSHSKPIARTRSVSPSPKNFGLSDNLEDFSSRKVTKIRNASHGQDVVKSSTRSRIFASREKLAGINPVTPLKPVTDKKGTETTVSWYSLPPNLVKLGKEVQRHRDTALLAAVEALQEASASERLIKCLSTYSDLQSSKVGDLQSVVDRFLDFHDDLVQSRLIARSLVKISPLRNDVDPISLCSIKETVKLTLERKKAAYSWIKAAMTSDLSPFTDLAKSTTHSDTPTDTSIMSTPNSQFSKPKGALPVRKQRKNGDMHVGLTTVKDNPIDWVKGSSLDATSDLANMLHGQCRQWFLNYIEKYLGGVTSEKISMASDSQVANIMCRIKKVDEWLGVIMSKNSNFPKDGTKDGLMCEDEESEACERVRNKLYLVLLKFVERSAIALESTSSTSSP